VDHPLSGVVLDVEAESFVELLALGVRRTG
jgi:hypothetical protein